mgnify:CR=1 FL=1
MSNIEMKTEYGGYQIKWNDFGTMFEIYKDDVGVKTHIETLENCQKWIDQKNKQKFKRIPILREFGYQGDIQFGEATSMIESNYVWVCCGKERNKVEIFKVWLDTPKNRQAIVDINNKREQITKLYEEIEEIEDSTDRLTAKMMIEEGE